MDAVTYPDKKVIDFVQNSFIPLKVPYNTKPLSDDFNVRWTPTLVTLGTDMKEHHRTVGFLEPSDFVANGLLGIGKYHFDNSRFSESLSFFEKIVSEYPQSSSTPEAIFMRGVARYKNTGERSNLKEVYETLSSRYPDSEWARKATPYKVI